MANQLDDLYKAWKAKPDGKSMQALLHGMSREISSGIVSYGGGDRRLVTRAHILAAQAVKSHDPAKASLSTHVHSTLRGLSRYRDERQETVHVPDNVKSDWRLLRNASAEWEDAHGSEPDEGALMEITGLGPRRIASARRAYTERSEGVDTETSFPEVGLKDDRFDMWTEFVYHDMDEKSRKIMDWTTGRHGAKILPKHVVAKRLKITPAAVSGRISTIRKKLSEFHEPAD